MVKVAIVPNYSRQEAVLDASRLTEFLEKQSIEVVWAPDKKKTNVIPLNVDAVSYTHLTLPTNREV